MTVEITEWFMESRRCGGGTTRTTAGKRRSPSRGILDGVMVPAATMAADQTAMDLVLVIATEVEARGEIPTAMAVAAAVVETKGGKASTIGTGISGTAEIVDMTESESETAAGTEIESQLTTGAGEALTDQTWDSLTELLSESTPVPRTFATPN